MDKRTIQVPVPKKKPSKKLTQAVLSLAQHKQMLDEAYPDVGMPPPWSSFVDEAMADLNLTTYDIDYDSIA